MDKPRPEETEATRYAHVRRVCEENQAVVNLVGVVAAIALALAQMVIGG